MDEDNPKHISANNKDFSHKSKNIWQVIFLSVGWTVWQSDDKELPCNYLLLKSQSFCLI